jgi:gas vesicle protein
MNQENTASGTVAVMSFIAGAAVGALVVALTTPRTGQEIRSDLKALGRRAKERFGEGEEKLEQVTEEARDKVSRAKAELQS